MGIRWKLIVTQTRMSAGEKPFEYNDSLIFYHDNLESICRLVYSIESEFDADHVRYVIESEVVDNGKD